MKFFDILRNSVRSEGPVLLFTLFLAALSYALIFGIGYLTGQDVGTTPPAILQSSFLGMLKASLCSVFGWIMTWVYNNKTQVSDMLVNDQLNNPDQQWKRYMGFTFLCALCSF